MRFSLDDISLDDGGQRSSVSKKRKFAWSNVFIPYLCSGKVGDFLVALTAASPGTCNATAGVSYIV